MLILLVLLLCSPLLALTSAPFQVSEIVLVGNLITQPWVIERELRFDVEDSVTTEDLEAAHLRLLSLGIFNNARVDYDDEGVVTVQVSEQFRFIPVFGADAVEGSLGDALKEPDRIMDIVVVTAGVADINHRGTGAVVSALGEFGARSGLSIEYRTRWLSPRKPVALSFGLRSMRVSDRHASVLGYSRRLRNDRAYFEIATKRGAPSRVGVLLKYDRVKEGDEFPATGINYETGWIAPYIILDRRNLEWYPTKGIFARGDAESAFGTVGFVRSRAVLAVYLPFAKSTRPLTLATRMYGGTAQSTTPAWARYYFGFSDKFRGYSSVQTEAATYLGGEVELRFPLTREITYDVPFVGRYGDDIPFWLGGSVFFERAQTQLDGTRNDVFAYGTALHIRFPYVQIFEISASRNRDEEFDLVFSTGLRF